MKKILAIMAAFVVSAFAMPVFAATLPNGTCAAVNSMTVVVKGGKITSYKYGRKFYEVAGAAPVYKIGSAGKLTIQSAKTKSFKVKFQLPGKPTTYATLHCK